VQQVRGLAVVLFITTFFGALWGMVGAFALPGAVSLLAGVLVGTVTVVLLLAPFGYFGSRSACPSRPVRSARTPLGPVLTGWPYSSR
jgi:hypothetical protein